MNERIKQLAEQATDYYSNGQERTFNKEKFGELIVRECITVADEYQNWPIRAIREHFGVEE